MVLDLIIAYGIHQKIIRKKASPVVTPDWLESLERCRKSFGLEKMTYEYWSYPSPKAEGSFWVKSNLKILIFMSEGFLKVATESQLASMMESLNAQTLKKTRKTNLKTSIAMVLYRIKGDATRYRYWVFSFFLYPLERFLKIAKI